MLWNLLHTIKNLTDLLPLKVNWLKILRSFLNFDVEENYEFYLPRPEFVKSMFQLFESMDNRLFANIFHFRFLLEFNEIYSLYFVNAFENELWGVQNAQQRFEQCVTTVRTRIPVAFTSLLIKRFTNQKMIEDAHDIANRTMKIIINDVEKDETLPYENKQYMLKKLRSLKIIFGYPEELLFDKNVEHVYKNLDLSGNETFTKLLIETFTFSKIQTFSNFVKYDNIHFERNKASQWIDYTTEDEYEIPLYNIDDDNTICKKKFLLFNQD